MSDLPAAPDSPVFSADIMNRAMSMLDPGTQELLKRERAGLELGTAMAAVALSETLGLPEETCDTFTKLILERARALPPEHHRHTNILLSRLHDSVLLPDVVRTSPTSIVAQVMDDKATTAETPTVPLLAEATNEASDIPTNQTGEEGGDIETTVEQTNSPEDMPEQDVIEPKVRKLSLLDQLLDRMPELADQTTSTNGNSDHTAAEQVGISPEDTTSSANSMDAATTEQTVVANPDKSDDATPKPPAMSEKIVKRDFTAELGLKEHFRVPRNMSSFIRNVMPQSFSDRIANLDPESASLIGFMLMTDYLTSDETTMKIKQEARDRNALILSKYVGIYELDKDPGSIARALNTNSSDVRKRIETSEKALKTLSRRDRLKAIFEAGEAHLVVEDMLPGASKEEALTEKK